MNRFPLKSIVIIVVLVCIGIIALMFGMPLYNVWQQEMTGKAEFSRAEQNRKIKVEEAKAFIKEKEDEYTKLFANPYNAAKYGYIDDVIEPRNTRFRIIRALAQLQNKRLTNPAKKHGNIPL